MGCAADRAANTLKSAPTCCFHSCSMLLSRSLIFRFAMPKYLPQCVVDNDVCVPAEVLISSGSQGGRECTAGRGLHSPHNPRGPQPGPQEPSKGKVKYWHAFRYLDPLRHITALRTRGCLFLLTVRFCREHPSSASYPGWLSRPRPSEGIRIWLL